MKVPSARYGEPDTMKCGLYGTFSFSSLLRLNLMAVDSLPASSRSETVAKVGPAAKPRLWPAAVLVAVYWIVYFVVSRLPADVISPFMQFMTIFYAPMVLGLGIVIWWLGFSRLPFIARIWGLACVAASGGIALALSDKSMNWMNHLMSAMPIVLTAVVVWLVITSGAKSRAGWIGIAAVSLLTWGYFTLIRVDGVTASLSAERSFRWTATAEDKYLAEQRKASAANASGADGTPLRAFPTETTAADWPEFRGALRDGIVRGVSIEADWTAHPPREVWRRRVGPAWSSCAVVGNHVFTQEQRGEVEAVVCIDLATGQELWSYEDKARFWEVVAGAGPRATPTFHGGKIYAFGGSGKLHCLDAATGKPIWSRDVAAETDTKLGQWGWGYSSSPLVTQGVVTVFAICAEMPGKKTDEAVKRKSGVFAYDALTGEPRWAAGQGKHGYSSPQLVKIAGDEQVLMVSDHGLEAFNPATGELLWENKWLLDGMFRVCQPQILDDSRLLVGTPMMEGTRQLTISKDADEWKVTEGWTSKELKPYFNDGVLYEGHLYGFDGDILICIDPATGKKKWKKGRYGHGQCLLVGDQGLLIVISDKGELVLIEASPKELIERGRLQALTGKTWNHPVLTSSAKLLVRNGEEMACFDLTSAEGSDGRALLRHPNTSSKSQTNTDE